MKWKGTKGLCMPVEHAPEKLTYHPYGTMSLPSHTQGPFPHANRIIIRSHVGKVMAK